MHKTPLTQFANSYHRCFTLTLFITMTAVSSMAQVHLTGVVVDANDLKPLPYVNIGIRDRDIGVITTGDGAFSIVIPQNNIKDTLTFSMVGYQDVKMPIAGSDGQGLSIQMTASTTKLREVEILGTRMVEQRYGIKNRGLVHFTDGMFRPNDSFEIGQVLRFGKGQAFIKSISLYINAARTDSGTFRINFYQYDDKLNRPASRIVDQQIIQRHAIREGWLNFDLAKDHIIVSDNVFASIEFIPEPTADVKPIYYAVRIGGTSKSFYRKSSLGKWNMPPHHFCIFVTAVVDKQATVDIDDVDLLPTFTLKSPYAAERYRLFVRLPKGYNTHSPKKHPVVYQLDGNAYFDAAGSAIERMNTKGLRKIDPIIVGIGYSDAYVMDSLRNRDYTYPYALAEDSFKVSGGAEVFYRFLTKELIPAIDQQYSTDTLSRTIVGHSLGGLFVMYALSKDINGITVFKNYVAASPSLWYHNGYLKEMFREDRVGDYDRHVYLSVGSTEVTDAADPFQGFDRTLKKLGVRDVKVNVYDGLEHMGTAIPTIEDGLNYVLQPQD